MRQCCYLLVLVVLAAGCQESADVEQNDKPAGENQSKPDQHDALLQAVQVRLTTPAASVALESKALLELPLNHPTLVEVLQRELGGPFFAEASGLTDRGQAVLDVLIDSHRHAMDPQKFHLDAIQKRLDSLQRDAAPVIELTQADRDAIAKWASSNAAPEGLDAQVTAVFDPTSSPVPALATTSREAAAHADGMVSRVAELEILLADGVLTWMHDMRHRNVSDFTPPMRLAHGDERLRRQRMVESFKEVATGETAVHLVSLEPKHPQYTRLLAAVGRYRQIVADGGWPEVHPRKIPMQYGQRGEHVEHLQQRLQAEGFYEGEVSGHFDSPTKQAVVQYQKAHQLGHNGILEEPDLKSLNYSAERRLAQVEVTLDRWRDTRVLAEPYYIHVNVPGFHAEVWQEGERIHRFRVIVGNQSRYFSDDREEWVYINKTPLTSELMDALIFNPYWNVTPRVKRELEEKVAEEPDYYEKNGYEVMSSGRVRQTPGDHNVLGRVKFQFPNKYDIYMHDTDKRPLFKYPLRAFSHGCIRVDEPMELASLLFKHEGRSGVKWRIEQYLKGGDEDWTMLREMVPIHIEYYTVYIDDAGVAHFGADIYRYDRPLVDARMGLESDPHDPS